MFSKLRYVFNTAKHLKWIQIRYQIYYRLNRPGPLNKYDGIFDPERISFLSFIEQPPAFISVKEEDSKFSFLNQDIDFSKGIDWNFQGNGKLWNYNLQYLNFLLQDNLSVSYRLGLIESLKSAVAANKLPLEPYPVSLRSINILRFASLNHIIQPNVLSFVHAELDFLSNYPEYHLLGNHLLENAFALIMGGGFFSEKKWQLQGKSILIKQLNEQILADGAHCELSPMYHQIIFFRLLELIDWYSKFDSYDSTFGTFLYQKAELMLTWLVNMTFANGTIPHFNDSAEGISYSSSWLLQYADKLNVKQIPNLMLSESGYRFYRKENYECVIDAAEIGLTYQPGHGHADSLSFLLNFQGKPLLVERGTSTYEDNNKRQKERSTESHNTVVVANTNQSEVYGAFRVGNRAKTQIVFEDTMSFSAEHDGYLKAFGITHNRSFQLEERDVMIVDKVDKKAESSAYFHFHPSVKISRISESAFSIVGIGKISFSESIRSEIINYEYAIGYNRLVKASALKIKFFNLLKTRISFNIEK